MKEISDTKRNEIINLGLFSISLIPVILYLYVIYQRISLPFDLEWGEGAGINQISRILSGEPLYAAPTENFAALVYTPFYYWLSSLLAVIAHEITFAARLISVMASFGSAGIVAWLVHKETGNRMASWLAGVLYLACFALSDGFYDLVRVDSLYVLVLLVSFFFLRASSKPAGKIAAGLAIALGFFIKQSTLIVFFPITLYLVIKNWRTYWTFLLTVLLGVLGPFYWLNARSEGWFNYYIIRLPKEHGYSLVSAVNFWVGDLMGPLGIALGFGLVYLLLRWAKQPGRGKKNVQLSKTKDAEETEGKERRNKFQLFALFSLGAVGAAWATRASNGGGANNAMSAYAAISLLFGLGFNEVGKLIAKDAKTANNYSILVASFVTIQFIGLIYNPFNFLPTAAEVRANEMLIDEIAEIDGLIWAPYRSHLPRLVGKKSSIHAVNLFELTGYFKGTVLPEGNDLVQQIRENVCNQAYGLIVLDQPIPWIDEQLSMAYQQDRKFGFLDGERRSSLLVWQGGLDALFIPRHQYNPDVCLSRIP